MLFFFRIFFPPNFFFFFHLGKKFEKKSSKKSNKIYEKLIKKQDKKNEKKKSKIFLQKKICKKKCFGIFLKKRFWGAVDNLPPPSPSPVLWIQGIFFHEGGLSSNNLENLSFLNNLFGFESKFSFVVWNILTKISVKNSKLSIYVASVGLRSNHPSSFLRRGKIFKGIWVTPKSPLPSFLQKSAEGGWFRRNPTDVKKFWIRFWQKIWSYCVNSEVGGILIFFETSQIPQKRQKKYRRVAKEYSKSFWKTFGCITSYDDAKAF